MLRFRFCLLGLVWLGCGAIISGQSTLQLFTDCNCDQNFLIQNLPFVDHASVPTNADIRLLVSEGSTGGGGRRYDLAFSGQEDLSELQVESSFEVPPNSTDDFVRRQLLAQVKRGLLPFLMATDYTERIDYTVSVLDTTTAETGNQIRNNWNRWVFEVSAEGGLESETSQKAAEVEAGLEANRTTQAQRVRLDAEWSYAERKISRDDDETFIRIRRRRFAAGSIVFSLNSHWSLGGFAGYEHSTYENLNHSFWLNPALEYNVYPYSEVLRREITFAYRIGYRYNEYLEKTIFEETAEHLYNTSLYVQARFRQPWGNINASFDASAYLHDLSKNRLVLDSYIDLILFGGLAVRLSLDLQLVRDQLNLPAGETSVEDLLLRQRQIATDFRLGAGIGFRYTFGAISNNVINYRL